MGLRGAATILHLCGIHARCFLRVDRSSRRKNRGDDFGPIRAVILHRRGTVREKGESLPHRRAPSPLGTQDSAFACRSPNAPAFATGSRSERSILHPLMHEHRTLRPPEPRSECSLDPGPIRRSRPSRRTTRLGATATQQRAQAQRGRRRSTREPSYSDAAVRASPTVAAPKHARARPRRRSSECRPRRDEPTHRPRPLETPGSGEGSGPLDVESGPGGHAVPDTAPKSRVLLRPGGVVRRATSAVAPEPVLPGP